MDCMLCTFPNTDRMVSCCVCGSWMHYECVGVNDSIAAHSRSFYCPPCQRPTPRPQPPVEEPGKKHDGKAKSSKARSKAGSKAGSKASSVQSGVGARTRLAQLKIQKLEEQKKLALQRLELESKQRDAEIAAKKQVQEAELAALKLQVETEALEETFRLLEELEIGDEDGDGRSVASEQSSRSKVTRWQQNQEVMSSTLMRPTKTSAGTGQRAGNPTTSGTVAGQDYANFFAKNALNQTYPGYRAPPGTQHHN